jgi:type I restriction enzyme M protein
MLTAETRRRIDSARDILVGQLPLPTDQVELITIALIYKFMDDIDEQSRELGGRATFFTGELRDLSWRHIISNTLSADARVTLFTRGIEAVSDPKHTQIPDLFKSIFRNAFLKFRDGRTLKLFLDEINGFTYDHSEELGNAFEYLLESMGVQADNGQFRTPRHIIEFIVDVVDPQKNETILDPACGTAGFLISAYKHILAANTSAKAAAKNPHAGDLLDSKQRDTLTHNLVGYDITPLMCRLSRVNMYLHHFPNPVIHEYDTLTNKNRWDEKADVIHANPPFMTPKGGIKPHDRFAISANRSEVLFVDYIAEHLNPNGRAGVIVPEGIIFQSQNAYKELRRMLVDGFLWAVVSLPAGVFNPYSGVKTSILFLDRVRVRQTDEILFVKVNSDGYDLGAQRRPIEQNDLPEALKAIRAWKKDGKVADEELAHAVSRKRILESSDINLSGDRYRASAVRVSGKWPMVKLEDVCKFMTGGTPTSSNKAYYENGEIPWLVSGDIHKGEIFDCEKRITKAGMENSNAKFLPKDSVLIALNGQGKTRGTVALLRMSKATCNQSIVSINPISREKLLPEFLFFQLHGMYSQIRNLTGDNERSGLSISIIKTIHIALPPVAEQKRLVGELEGYSRIIESARQILASYKPTLRLNPAWPMVSVGDVLQDVKYTTKVQKSEFLDRGKFPIVDQSQNDIAGYWNNPAAVFHISQPVVLFGDHTRALKYVDFDFVLGADGVKILQPDERFIPRFFHLALMNVEIPELGYSRHFKELVRVQIPVPPLAEQRALVAELEAERKLVEANRDLAARFEQKLQSKLSEIWGE